MLGRWKRCGRMSQCVGKRERAGSDEPRGCGSLMRRPCGCNRNPYRYCTWNSVHSRAEARLLTVYFLVLVMQRVMLRKQLCRRAKHLAVALTEQTIRGTKSGAYGQRQDKGRRSSMLAKQKRETASDGPGTRVVFLAGATPARSEKPSKAGCPSSTAQAPTFRAVSIVPSTFSIRVLSNWHLLSGPSIL